MAFKNRRGVVKDLLDNITAKRDAAEADADRKAIRLDRETRGVQVGSVGKHTNPDNPEQQMNRDIVSARGRAAGVRARVKKRKK